MSVIDMHNHFIAPEVIDYLGREGKHYATRMSSEMGAVFMIRNRRYARSTVLSQMRALESRTWIARASRQQAYRAYRS